MCGPDGPPETPRTPITPSNTINVHSPFRAEEDIESTEKLILRLLKEDHDEFTRCLDQKGEGEPEQITGIATSLAIWGHEVRNANQHFRDRAMALSISNAITTDQLVITGMEQQEAIAQRDRAFALRLNNNPEHVQEPEPPAEIPAQCLDNISESIWQTTNALGEACASQTQAVSTTSQEPSSEVNNDRAYKCISCFSKIHNIPICQLPCNHHYCDECLHRLFIMATTDEGLYPPRCCGNVFSPNIAMRLLDFKELAAFCSAGVEFTARNRLYCAVPSCSSFIPPWLIHDEKGTCPKCSETTHTACGALWNMNHECPNDEALQQVLGMAENESWKRCPQCRTMVELRRGCNHITCRCGAEFCYVCCLKWQTCDCPLWDVNNLLDVAQRNADIEVGPEADGEVRAEALAAAVQHLYDHEVISCQHHLRSQWRWTNRPDPMECEVCGHQMNEYIFQCRQCGMLACNRCRRNRVR